MPTTPRRSIFRSSYAIAGLVVLLTLGGVASALPHLGSAGTPTAPGSVAIGHYKGSAGPTLAPKIAPIFRPHPANAPTLPCSTNPPWPLWVPIPDGIAPNPIISDQLGCTLHETQDEVHNSFLSPVAHSGERFTEGIHFPKNGNQTGSYAGMYLGMVVYGDNLSAFNESYLEVTFYPVNTTGQISYTATISVYSLINGTTGNGTPGNPYHLACPGLWNGLAWNNSLWCEGVDFSNGKGILEPKAVPGGSTLNVTFVGTAKTGAVTVYANDSVAADSFNVTLDSATTGNHSFSPEFSAACETCLLNWGMGFGNGIGVGMCPAAAAYPCDSYDVYPWTYDSPVEFGIPEFWNGTAYATDFTFLGFESASGDCSLIPGTYEPISVCQYPPGNTAFYPYFTYNGTRMAFGTTYNWTTWDFGGPSIQYNVLAAMSAVTPLRIDSVADSSHGGYVAGGHGFNVTTRLQVVGHLVNGSLVYKLGNGGWSSLALTQVNGSSTHGFFNATIPATGPNGTFTYWIYAVDRAGSGVVGSEYTVTRGPLPTFKLTMVTVPAFCGGAVLNGTRLNNSQFVFLHPGTYSLTPIGCYPYTNPTFVSTRNLVVHQALSEVVVRGNGTLTLLFTFSPPPLKITIATSPAGCGAINLGGANYTDASVATVTWNQSYPLAYFACGNASVFAGYTFVGSFNVTVSNTMGTFLALSNGTLTLHLIASGAADPLFFETQPAKCTGIYFAGTLYLDGTSISVASGTYAIAPDPCALWGFKTWNVFGTSSSVSGNNLTIGGSTTLQQVDYRLTIINVVISPASCGTIQIDGTNYTSGAAVVVTNNSTHLAYPFGCPGYSLLAFTANGGLTLVGNLLTANGSGELIATYINGTAPNFVGFITNPAYCGSITFEGVKYYDTNFTSVATGTVATLSATPCKNYGFLAWVAQGPAITIKNNTAYISSFGAITAVFTPLVNLFIQTNPPGCGTVVVGGIPYAGGSTPAYAESTQLTLSANPCPGYQLSTWIHSPDVNITGNLITVNGPATLEAVFTPLAFAVHIFVSPANCGTVTVNDVPAFNGSLLSLSAGTYPILTTPCRGDHIIGYTVVGSLALNAADTELNVTGSGNLTILLEPIPPAIVLYVPTSTESGAAISIGVTVGTLIPPYALYSYNWSFGDGTSERTSINVTDHTYASPGVYTVSVVVTDPLGRTASANGSIDVITPSAVAPFTSLIPAALAIGAAAVAILAAYWFTTPRVGRSAPKGPDGPAESPPDEETYGSPSPPAAGEGEPDQPLPREP